MPTAWPTPVAASDPTWTDGTMDIASENINNGLFAFWFNDDDCLQVAEQRPDTIFNFGFRGEDIVVGTDPVFNGAD